MYLLTVVTTVTGQSRSFISFSGLLPQPKREREWAEAHNTQHTNTHTHRVGGGTHTHTHTQSGVYSPSWLGLGPHTTAQPSEVPVIPLSVPGMNTDWVNSPVDLLKSWRDSIEGIQATT